MVQSCRRTLVDELLIGRLGSVRGRLIDIGGKKTGSRGVFRLPPESECVYLNIDPATHPDCLCDAECIDCASDSFDGFLLIEVLEHVANPDKVLTEAFRVLTADGWGIITAPFMYPVHADPADMQRWTADKLRMELGKAGFQSVEVIPMGGPASVIFDVLWSMYWRTRSVLLRRVFGGLLALMKPLAFVVDKMLVRFQPHITTGWGAFVAKGVGGVRGN